MQLFYFKTFYQFFLKRAYLNSSLETRPELTLPDLFNLAFLNFIHRKRIFIAKTVSKAFPSSFHCSSDHNRKKSYNKNLLLNLIENIDLTRPN